MLVSAIFAFVFLLAAPAFAQTPLKLCLWAPDRQWPADGDVSGLRLAIYGSSQNITGADISVVGKTEGDFLGAAFNFAYGSYKGNMAGAAFGLVSSVEKKACGFLAGLYSEAQSMTGVQFGLVNKTTFLNGLQFGFVNFASAGNGVQIGFVNFFDGAKYPLLPIVNAKF